MVDVIHKYILKQGYTFSKRAIINFYVSLKTKPFVILTGISGTGKTKLAQLFVEAVWGQDKDAFFKMIPVQPDWNAPRFLLGFYNPLTEKYEKRPFLEMLISAVNDPDYPYFVCLDEMNLARVEYYFSTFLSALESNEPIELHSEKDESGKAVMKNEVPAKIKVPKNLYFIGTVNVDETTHQFSPKVLDRANVIEFTEVDLKAMFDNLKKKKDENSDTPGSGIDSDEFSLEFMAKKEDKGWYEWLDGKDEKGGKEIVYEFLNPINIILKESNLHFGYRVCQEILEYMFWAKEFTEVEGTKEAFTKTCALDMQVMQKILPKIKGGQDIDKQEQGTLSKLETFLDYKKLSLSAKRVGDMKKQLKDEGYTDFWKR